MVRIPDEQGYTVHVVCTLALMAVRKMSSGHFLMGEVKTDMTSS